jgi:hypothetical protein
MNLRTKGRARAALNQQLEIFNESHVSLHSLWRVWGSPKGLDPRNWSKHAEPLLSGVTAYRANVDQEGASSSDLAPLLWTWEEESKDPWLTGDLMGEEFIAWAYATYLDTTLASRRTGANRLLMYP